MIEFRCLSFNDLPACRIDVMRDLLSWSLPLGRLFGVTVRLHILFPVIALGLILRLAVMKDAPSNIWTEGLMLMGLLLVAVLLHEFGHCFGARTVDGDATEVLLWPLGGLAFVEVPHTPRANLITAAAGPLVDLVLCLLTGAVLFAVSVRPPLSPLWVPIQYQTSPSVLVSPELFDRAGEFLGLHVAWWKVLLARFFWINWLLFLLNMVLVGFPMDMGRILQCALWPRLGFRQATQIAVRAGFVTAIIVGIVSIVYSETLFLALALFIMFTCYQQLVLLETGGEESVFGYDFSHGYTSLEREQIARRRRPSVWQRWWQKRQARKLQREMEQREAEENRMDMLLEKVQREGLQSLSQEERRFLTRVSAKYRNRQ
jgi:stage IV sporulation protein FB